MSPQEAEVKDNVHHPGLQIQPEQHSKTQSQKENRRLRAEDQVASTSLSFIERLCPKKAGAGM